MRFLVLVSCLLPSSICAADQLCVTANAPLSATPWNTSVSVPRFDPAYGALNAVTVEVTGFIQGEARLESTAPHPLTINTYFSANVDVLRPDMSFIASAAPTQAFGDSLGAFDGIIDYRGTSGFTHIGITATATGSSALAAVADIGLFSGPYGAAGIILLPISASNTSYIQPSLGLNPLFVQDASAIVRVCYDYTAIAAAFCAGDGAGAPCPCANFSAAGAGEGCLNSFGLGAVLRGTGHTSVQSDTLVLTCSQLPPATTGLFFQGDASVSSGAGAAFGDGLRCVGGSVVRLGTKTASSGVVTYPQAGDAPVSVRGNVPPNSVRFYQLWYRNSASFCTASTFNLSEGVGVTWSP